MRKFIFFVLLACVLCTVRGQATYDYRYWFDNNDSDQMTGTLPSEKWNIDVDLSGLDNALHSVHIQVKDTSEIWSPAVTRWFLKTPTAEELYKVTCVCMIDGVPFREEMLTSESGVVNWDLDVSSISQGVHFFQVQIFDSNGFLSNTYEDYFYRSITDAELENVKVLYRVDDGEFKELSNSVGAGVYHFDIDVSSLDNGVHRLTCMFTSENGLSTKISNSFFLKLPVGGSGIKAYRYWLNVDGAVNHVELPDRPSVYELISLLPVESYPIRSSCFHFEMTDDGTPMIYAKNDMHILFYDAFDRSTEVHKQYVDYNVGKKVEEFTLLESGKRIYKAKPQDNKIYWFKTEAVAGDSLSIKTDQACTLQIFSPSGKEMYCGSGSETVSFDGCHADEDGTYYIALHDVTGTKGNTIALDFQHIDKYDVLRWDVSTVGNGGASTITYEGNGFKDLYAIDYVSTNGDTIKCEYIDHISDATISATMDFNGATLGIYKAIFHFTEGDRVVNNVVKVEEATEMKLGIVVNYPSTFLRGTTCRYDIKITNYGNSTAYAVPLGIQLYDTNKDAIKYLKFDKELEKIDLSWLYNSEELVKVPEDTIKAIRRIVEEKGDLIHFATVYDSIHSKYIKDSYLTLTIAPKSTYNISLEIQSDNRIELYASVPQKWVYYIINDNSYPILRNYRSGVADNICCAREKVECFLNVIVSASDFLSILGGNFQIANCITSVSNQFLQFSYDVWCGEKRGGKNIDKALRDLRMTAVNTLLTCISPKWDKYNLTWIYEHIYDVITTTQDCVSAFYSKPNCPPTPPTGGSSSPVNSYDPNDIYGYRSESGSKAVKKDWTDVYYTIEFENDTAFATASAQDVYLTDTLDSRYFDLKSFAPTSLKIGDKKVELSGEPNFVTTVDMRPKINAIAQVECQYDEQRGIAKWHFTSLDPMTMEHVTVPMDGFLPVNNSEGDGQGEVSFNVRLKTGLADGEQIPNRASIVFDLNEAIMTLTWINVVDTIAPQSAVVETAMKNDTIMTIFFDGTDNYSGVWKYDLYVQAGVGASWFKLAENLTDSLYDYRVYDGIDYGFCVIATDSAGNVEQKELIREWPPLDYLPGDANGDGCISVVDLTMVTNAILRKEDEGFNAKAADLNMDGQISITDATMITNLILKK